MSSRTHFFILAIFLPLLSSVGAQAQNYRSSINGTVTDPSGASVSEATITAADTATGIVYKSAPSSTGEFVFPDLPPGSYKVTVTASGFDTVQIDNVTVAAGAIYTLPVALKVAQSATVIEVSGVAATLDTTTATDVTNIPSEQIKNIPLMGRDFTELIAIAPGFGGYNVHGPKKAGEALRLFLLSRREKAIEKIIFVPRTPRRTWGPSSSLLAPSVSLVRNLLHRICHPVDDLRHL
jgi:hypothetical protein